MIVSQVKHRIIVITLNFCVCAEALSSSLSLFLLLSDIVWYWIALFSFLFG